MNEFQEFPKMLYKDGDITKKSVIVEDADQEAKATKKNYVACVPVVEADE